MEFPRLFRGNILDRNSFQLPEHATPSTNTPVDLLPVSHPNLPPQVAHDPVYLPIEQMQQLVSAFWRKAQLLPQPFTVGTTPVLIRPAEDRYYFFIINYDPANNMAVNFGKPPSSVTDGLQLLPNGYYEPLAIPQQEIWVLGSAAGIQGAVLVAAIQ